MRYDLRLSDIEFGELTAARFDLLCQRKRDEEERVAMITAAAVWGGLKPRGAKKLDELETDEEIEEFFAGLFPKPKLAAMDTENDASPASEEFSEV